MGPSMCVLFGWWFIPWELWGYWLVHIVVPIVIPPMGLQTPSAPWVLSLAPSLGTLCSVPMDDCEHLLLYLPGISRASQETAISGFCQQALVGIPSSIWGLVTIYGMDPQVGQSLDGPSFRLCSELCLCNSFHGSFVPPSKKDSVLDAVK